MLGILDTLPRPPVKSNQPVREHHDLAADPPTTPQWRGVWRHHSRLKPCRGLVEMRHALSSPRRPGGRIGHTRGAVVDKKPLQGGGRESESSSGAPEQGRGLGERELPVQVPAEIRNVSFPLSVRGYSRPAVDAYLERVNRLIAELEVGSSPRAAVRHALERVTEQVGGILERARESAEEITTSAREEAEESTAGAKADAAEFVVNASDEADRTKAEAEELLGKARAEADELLAHSGAEAEQVLARSRAEADERLQQSEGEVAALRDEAEARMRELDADTEAVWQQRHELLEDVRAMAGRLEDAAREAAARFPGREPANRPEEAMPEPEARAEPEPSGVAARGEPTGPMPAVGSHEGGDAEGSDAETERSAPDPDS
jgi:DivIVA domain-containing protein